MLGGFIAIITSKLCSHFIMSIASVVVHRCGQGFCFYVWVSCALACTVSLHSIAFFHFFAPTFAIHFSFIVPSVWSANFIRLKNRRCAHSCRRTRARFAHSQMAQHSSRIFTAFGSKCGRAVQFFPYPIRLLLLLHCSLLLHALLLSTPNSSYNVWYTSAFCIQGAGEKLLLWLPHKTWSKCFISLFSLIRNSFSFVRFYIVLLLMPFALLLDAVSFHLSTHTHSKCNTQHHSLSTSHHHHQQSAGDVRSIRCLNVIIKLRCGFYI